MCISFIKSFNIFIIISSLLFLVDFFTKRNEKKILPVSVSRAIQAILFALFHGTLTHLCPTFIFALFNAYLFDKYKNLKVSMISHICYNACSVLLPSLIHIPINNVTVITSSLVFVSLSLYLLLSKCNQTEFFDDLSIFETLS
nr:CPBP family intramembrane glutamic endopeptidase [Finegoldia magna]